jgi:tetratricopeptide (TPR) repeat protein
VLSFSTIGIFARDHPLVVEMRLRRLADAYMDVGDAATAIAALQEAVAPCPTGCPWALKDLFEAYMRSGRLAEGEAYFRRFVADHPEQSDARDYVEQLGAALRAAAPTRLP